MRLPRQTLPTQASTSPGPAPRLVWNFDLHLDRWEVLGAIWVALGVLVLSLTPMNFPERWLPAALLWIGVASLNPFSALMLLPTAVIVPFPQGLAFNPAVLIFAAFLVRLILRWEHTSFSGISWAFSLLPFVLLLAWLWDPTVLDPTGATVSAIAYAMATAVLYNDNRQNPGKALLAVSLGCLTVVLAYWGNRAGLPIALSTWGGLREGFFRLGSARLDSVLVWPVALLGLAGLVGVAIAGWRPSREGVRGAPWLAFGAVFATLPVIVGTMTHGGVAATVLLAVLLLAWVTAIMWRHGRRRSGAQTAAALAAGVVLTGLGLIATNTFGLADHLGGLTRFYEEQSMRMGWAASRTRVWEQGLDLIARYPILGAPAEEVPTYASHSAFIDIYVILGLPGFLLFCIPYFAPAGLIFHRWGILASGPFLLAFAVPTIGIAVLPFTFFKPFWILWMVVARASAWREPGQTPRGTASGAGLSHPDRGQQGPAW